VERGAQGLDRINKQYTTTTAVSCSTNEHSEAAAQKDRMIIITTYMEKY
jgi:hypothetical protein